GPQRQRHGYAQVDGCSLGSGPRRCAEKQPVGGAAPGQCSPYCDERNSASRTNRPEEPTRRSGAGRTACHTNFPGELHYSQDHERYAEDSVVSARDNHYGRPPERAHHYGRSVAIHEPGEHGEVHGYTAATGRNRSTAAPGK